MLISDVAPQVDIALIFKKESFTVLEFTKVWLDLPPCHPSAMIATICDHDCSVGVKLRSLFIIN